MTAERIERVAAQLVQRTTELGLSIAVAESLTGGALASAIVGVPGASAVFRGGIVSYQTPIKAAVLGVDAELLAEVGAVDARVAEQMAAQARALFAVAGKPATLALATTGVAGPDVQDGHPVGEVFVSVAIEQASRVEQLLLHGSRDEIRQQAVAAALQLAADVVNEM